MSDAGFHSLRGHFFATEGLDRVAHLRRDPDWLMQQLHSPGSLLVPVWRDKSLVRRSDPGLRAGLVPLPDVESLIEETELVLLGTARGRAYFAADVSSLPDPRSQPALASIGSFVGLRRVGPFLDPSEGGLLAYARGMMHWHRTHAFCGACGSPTRSEEAGHVRQCTGDGCQSLHFPRTDPAIIVRVARGDRVLLARQAAWQPRRYSVLAGFVEPGESLEQAVRREVFEETGVRLQDVVYDSSQPWPFPASLMIGFVAEATTDEIRLGGEELVDARWLTREQIRSELAEGTLRLPPEISISRQLIEAWRDRTGGDP